ncbi:AfsR/SARP family transcriptional regulator [Streptomyces tsukubensis]|uniref:SARP family transcriptional regulator n=1 Tax=Streptomyces tsukubensis TaxID=83656 RepID=A0A1V4A1Y7_9ACTN|nr:BTAD domain-containing putative transcriptional regulator [Streptomyces tsukubensis]OON73307.1 SARP family transcriptional regulator [Streptomyces tsukubensis]QFR94529.1 SARP family transcriptional regulator [Streptomyces tsukubensis]
MGRVTFGVLGPVVAEGDEGPLALKGPRHRAVLARLIVARRRVVPVERLVEELWEDPPAGGVGAVQTFVAALRRVLEPARPPRAPATLLVTRGPGYALLADPAAVDAWRFEAAVGAAAKLPPAGALRRLEEALEMWRGPAYADFEAEPWAAGERSRLAELRLQAVERRAGALLGLGSAADAVPALEGHLADHPWREEAWRLLALAHYRTGRQGDALAVLREARETLADGLGVDPGAPLRRLEAGILAQDPGLEGAERRGTAAAGLWTRAAADYDRAVAAGARARLESTVGLIRGLAVTGAAGLETAREHRVAAVSAAEEAGDPELTAKVIGAFDVPAIWTRGDDPLLAERIVTAAERTLAALPAGSDTARCRLLATIALETRGARSARGPQAAQEAERIARRLDDPGVLAFALNGVFMQSCTHAGLAPRRDGIGRELVDLAARHGLVTYEVLGHLIRMQALGALGDFTGADAHASAVDRLAERHELPLAGLFTEWFRALRLAVDGERASAEAAYRAAAARLEEAGMPGLSAGLPQLSLLCLRLAGRPHAALDAAEEVRGEAPWGPYWPWVEPLALLRSGRRAEALAALRALPEPPADLMYEALTCLETATALELGDRSALKGLHDRLSPAAGEIAGAGSGLVTLGPVTEWLTAISAAIDMRTETESEAEPEAGTDA